MRRKVSPSLTTWLLFELTVAMSYGSYLAAGNRSIVGNIMNGIDLVMVTVVVTVMLIWGDRRAWRLDRFDLGCIGGALMILIAWGITSQAIAANLALQAIMVVAYFPTYKKLWSATSNTESYVLWISQLICACFALGAALMGDNFLGAVCAGRAGIMVFCLLSLMVRLRFR